MPDSINSTKSLEVLPAMFTSLVAAWTGFLAINRSLVGGSADAARSFMKSDKNPTHNLTKHFNDLVKWIHQPVVIFIDDLDRCQSSYVVELLEGIQTLFKDASVTYVIASDRRWLCTSYENTYSAFADTVKEPGRPLGYLFIEKTFQISATMPRISPELQNHYLQQLIKSDGAEIAEKQKKATEDAKQKIQELNTEDEFDAEIEKSSDPIYKQALREAAVVRLAAPDVEKHTEHLLKPFAPLLEPNPRAMKRFVNAYAMQKKLFMLGGSTIERGKLALWTILNLRWPLWAEFLLDNPEMVDYIKTENIAGISKTILDKLEKQGLQEFLTDKYARGVIQGEKDGERISEFSLDQNAIRSFAGLSTDTGMESVA